MLEGPQLDTLVTCQMCMCYFLLYYIYIDFVDRRGRILVIEMVFFIQSA